MKKLLSFGFHYINVYRHLYIVYIIICLFGSIIGVSLPLLAGMIINVITNVQKQEILEKYVFVFLLISMLSQLISVVGNHLYLKLQSSTGYNSNLDVIKKIYNSSYLNIIYEDPAMLNHKINNDCNSILIFCISLFRDLINNIASIIFIVVVLINQSFALSIVLMFLVLLYIVIYLVFKGPLYEVNYNVKENQTNFFGKLFGIVYNIKSIRNNGFQSFVFSQQEKTFNEYYTSLRKQLVVSNKFDIVTNFISLFSQIIVFIIGGNMVINGQMNLGIFVIISNYFSNLIQYTNYFLNLGQSYQNVKSSFDRVSKYTSVPQIHNGNKKLLCINEIEFKEVKFAYAGKNELFSFTQNFQKGKIYWIKGSNGIGKSTLINLFMGLFGVDYSGTINLNGIDIKELDYQYIIERKISIIEQQPYLLSDTFKNNMLWKCELDSYESELNELINEFRMQTFFEDQSMGQNTIYNSLNDNISGGEKQKIAIIRLLLSSSDIWILDEPTSSLDRESITKFYSTLKERKKDHITIIISHDYPLEYDEIIMLSDFSIT